MVSNKTLNKILISGAVLIAGCCLVLAYPSAQFDDEPMMADEDYEYEEDQSNPSPQMKPSSIAKANPPQHNQSVTVTGKLGEDVVLKCNLKITKDTVILWYQDSKIVTQGNSVVHPNFSLDQNTLDLTVLKASPQDAGDYYCQILPEKTFQHINLVLGDHSMDVIVPESSKSAQSSLHRITFMWVLTACLVLLQYKRLV